MLYLTHQPAVLATAACYLATRDVGIRMPECEWWEVFDCEREELGFLAVALGSLEGIVRREVERWGDERGMITREDINGEMKKLGNGHGNKMVVEDEETEMARMLDEKIGAA